MKELFQERASIWRHRDLRIAAAGRAVSFLGDEVAIVALLLRVHDDGGGTTGVAALLLAAALPTVLLAPLAGRFADQRDSRRVLVTCGLLQAALCLGLALSLPLLVTLGLVAGLQAVQAVSGPAWAALVPAIVGEDDTGRAVGAMQALSLLAGVAGPAVAGVLVALSGPSWPLVLDAVTFLVLAAAGAAMRTRRGGDTREDGPRARPLDGWRDIRADALIFPMLMGLLAFIAFGEITNVVEVFLVRDSLGASAAAFGLLGGVFAVGAAAGAVLGGRAVDDLGRARLASGAAIALGLLTIIGGLAPTVAVFGTVWLLTGLAVGVLNVAISTLVVVRAPERRRAQVIGSLSGLTRACAMVSTLLGGFLGLLAGPRTIYVAAGVGALAAALAMAWVVGRRLPAVAGAQSVGDVVEPSPVEH